MRFRVRGLLCSALVAAAVSAGAGSASATSLSGWSLAADFRVAPDQANPNPDSLGNPGVWHFLESASLAHAPAGYGLFPEFIDDRFNLLGLESWQSNIGDDPTDRLPTASFNARADNPVPFGIDWPPGTVLVHPLPNELVVVGWQSPISGAVQVSGDVIDRHSACGDGIDWSVDKGASTLASGVIPNGGGESFASGAGAAKLGHISVSVGTFLYFVVGPGPNGDHGCDSTGLEVTITAKKHV